MIFEAPCISYKNISESYNRIRVYETDTIFLQCPIKTIKNNITTVEVKNKT